MKRQVNRFDVIFLLIPSLSSIEALNVVANNRADLIKSEISVWDNVIPPETRNEVHIQASKSGLSHKAFQRRDRNSQLPTLNRPLIEIVIDNILTELGDAAPKSTDDKVQFVEYWTRQEWRHIEAHADVDEHRAKKEDSQAAATRENNSNLPFRYPTHGHVLYLKVGTAVEGPTCLFPNISSGRDLLKAEQSTELVTVPAVEGRLLRFSGDILHSVPRPADLWFLPFVKGSSQMTPEETWGRSVVLFNTWFGDPPKDVPLDTAKSLGNNEEAHSRVNNRIDWDDTFSLEESSANGNVCRDQKFGRPAKVWLLGNERRRGYHLRTIKLKAPEITKELLLEKFKVGIIELTP
mmetsp:Transcript_3943/g.5710  ORF Transcript_3943/g.5710 Transcript_3943/m.5710 type:complete len:350 (+) Transcript_3943:1026-2075(+)